MNHALLLKDATQAQLVEELARRINESRRAESPQVWCEDCVHFRAGTEQQAARATYNPCSKRHALQFWMPDPHDSPYSEFGHYIECCPDRREKEPGQPAAPAEPLQWDHPDYRQAPPPRGGGPKAVK